MGCRDDEKLSTGGPEYLGFKAFKILNVIEHNSQLHNDECKRT